MIIWVLVAALLTPWFWSLPSLQNMFIVDLQKDIVEAKSVVTWQRGKVANPSITDKLFLNWPGEVMNQRLAVVMENIDIGNYFFANHPRERVGINEKQKFFLFQFVLLLIGLTSSRLRKYGKYVVLYSLVAISATFLFKWRTFEQTLPLAIPFVVLIAFGLEKLIGMPHKYKIAFLVFSLLEIILIAI